MIPSGTPFFHGIPPITAWPQGGVSASARWSHCGTRFHCLPTPFVRPPQAAVSESCSSWPIAAWAASKVSQIPSARIAARFIIGPMKKYGWSSA